MYQSTGLSYMAVYNLWGFISPRDYNYDVMVTHDDMMVHGAWNYDGDCVSITTGRKTEVSVYGM